MWIASLPLEERGDWGTGRESPTGEGTRQGGQQPFPVHTALEWFLMRREAKEGPSLKGVRADEKAFVCYSRCHCWWE